MTCRRGDGVPADAIAGATRAGAPPTRPSAVTLLSRHRVVQTTVLCSLVREPRVGRGLAHDLKTQGSRRMPTFAPLPSISSVFSGPRVFDCLGCLSSSSAELCASMPCIE